MNLNLSTRDQLMEADEYRAKNSLPLSGYVVMISSQPVGWIPRLENAAVFQNGARAFPMEEGESYVARGGRYGDGAREWVPWGSLDAEDVPLNEEDPHVYHDGSGKHSRYLEWADKLMMEREERMKLQRAFIRKHNGRLAGLSWRVDMYETEIKLDCDWYRGSRTDAKAVAALWGEKGWKRVKPEYTSDEKKQRDWVKVVNGVTVRILKAEVYKPKPEEAPWPSSPVVEI